MKKFNLLPLTLLLTIKVASAQTLPEYNNSAVAWNNKTNSSVPLSPEEGLRSTKIGAANFVPMGSLFAKNKTVLRFQGTRSSARIAADDTLKIFVKIDQNMNPNGLFKLFRATIKNGNREVLAMTTSIKGAERSDGDFLYTITKISPGIFLVKAVGPKSGDELFFYIGTHDTAMAKMTLGID